MNKKLIKYLSTVDKENQTELDRILFFYADGKPEDLLNKYGATKIEIFPEISMAKQTIQITFAYYNLHIELDFERDLFNSNMFDDNCPLENIEEHSQRNYFSDDFNIEIFFEKLFDVLNKDEKLDKSKAEIEKNNLRKKKIFRIVVNTIFILSILIELSIVIHTVVTNTNASPWSIICILSFVACMIIRSDFPERPKRKKK